MNDVVKTMHFSRKRLFSLHSIFSIVIFANLSLKEGSVA
jgi:hypothetical protein